jgi:hypothetical protein
MARYGLVFKLEEQCWIAEYKKDGSVEDAAPIDDEEGIYAELNPREMSLVEIETLGDVDGGESVSLKDLKTITINNEDDPEKTLVEMFEDGMFPTLAMHVFREEKL